MSKIHSSDSSLAKFTSGTIHVVSPNRRSGAITADTLVVTGTGVYRGITVTTATAVGAIEVRDATSAGTGVVIDVIPAGTAAGTTRERNTILTTGLYIDYAVGATGTVLAEYL